MHMTEHLRSTRRAALAFGVGLAIAVSALGAGLASRASHQSAVLAPSCAPPQAVVPERPSVRVRECPAAAARLG